MLLPSTRKTIISHNYSTSIACSSHSLLGRLILFGKTSWNSLLGGTLGDNARPLKVK